MPRVFNREAVQEKLTTHPQARLLNLVDDDGNLAPHITEMDDDTFKAFRSTIKFPRDSNAPKRKSNRKPVIYSAKLADEGVAVAHIRIPVLIDKDHYARLYDAGYKNYDDVCNFISQPFGASNGNGFGAESFVPKDERDGVPGTYINVAVDRGVSSLFDQLDSITEFNGLCSLLREMRETDKARGVSITETVSFFAYHMSNVKGDDVEPATAQEIQLIVTEVFPKMPEQKALAAIEIGMEREVSDDEEDWE